MTTDRRRDLTLGITGASGARFAATALRALAARPQVGVLRVIVSDAAWDNLRAELDRPDAARDELERFLLDVPEGARKIVVHGPGEMAAPPASGSHRSDGTLVLPCSMASLAAIANGTGTTLIHRAADVALKQRRPLLLGIRESPYNLVHVENMVRAARAGAVLVPITVTLYHRPTSVEDVLEQYVGRVLDLLGLDTGEMPRWQGLRSGS